MTAPEAGDGKDGNEKQRVDLSFAAHPRHLSEVRRTLERLAQQTRLSQPALIDLLTAVDEAVANAIRHGSPLGSQNTVWVTCQVEEDALVVSVRDEGGGFPAPSNPQMPGPEATGGRGLPLMCALSDRVEISRQDGGTQITLQKRARPAPA